MKGRKVAVEFPLIQRRPYVGTILKKGIGSDESNCFCLFVPHREWDELENSGTEVLQIFFRKEPMRVVEAKVCTFNGFTH